MCEMLVQCGAEWVQDKHRENALSFYIWRSYFQQGRLDFNVVKYLMANTDINHVNADGESVLILALKLQIDEQVIRALVHAGADVNFVSTKGLGLVKIFQSHNGQKNL